MALVPVAGSVLVLLARSTLLAWPPLVWIGKISYPLYLWHWPLLVFSSLHWGGTASVRGAAVVASVVLAWATYTYIEAPIRHGPTTVRKLAAMACGTLGVCMLATIVYINDGVWSRYPKEVRPILAMRQFDLSSGARYGKCWFYDGNQGNPFSHYAPECRDGSTLVWGDSHAARLYPGMLESEGQVAQFARSGCPPIVGVVGNGGYCDASNRAIMKEIERLRPKTVILFARWLRYGADWRSDWTYTQEFTSTVRDLRGYVDNVVVVGPAPEWSPNLPDRVYGFWARHRRLPDRLPPDAGDYEVADTVLGGIARAQGARFVSMAAAMCNQSGCLTHSPESRSEIVSPDYGHFNEAGARAAWQWIGSALGAK